MPVLKVYGLPEKMEEKLLEELWMALRKVVERIPQMAITEESVTVFFPPDRLKTGLGEEVIIFVDGLFSKEARTEEARGRYAKELGETAKAFFKEAKVEVFVRPFDPGDGFWCS